MYKSPISILQELMMKEKTGFPDYMEDDSDITDAKFKCTVKVGQICASGYGSTKKEAKHESALKALEQLGLTDYANQIKQKSVFGCYNKLPVVSEKRAPLINYIGKLNEYASTHGQLYPEYRDKLLIVNGKCITYCHFINYKTEGCGLKKKDAKQDAARKMLEKLKDDGLPENMASLRLENVEKITKLDKEVLKYYENIAASTHNNVISAFEEIKAMPDIKNTVSSLDDLSHELQRFGHDYTIERFQRKPFIVMLKINGTSATLMGMGESEKDALVDLYQMAVYMFSKGFSLKF